MFVTPGKAREIYIVFIFSSFCQLLFPWFIARKGWARPDHENSDQAAYKSALSNVVSLDSTFDSVLPFRSYSNTPSKFDMRYKCLPVFFWVFFFSFRVDIPKSIRGWGPNAEQERQDISIKLLFSLSPAIFPHTFSHSSFGVPCWHNSYDFSPL